MQPSSKKGRLTRLAMMPLAWGLSFAVLILILRLTAALTHQDLKSLLNPGSLLLLIVALPGWYFGFIVGLMVLNLFAYAVPRLRRIFEGECRETGRHGFRRAMRDLSIFAIGSCIATITGLIAYVVIS